MSHSHLLTHLHGTDLLKDCTLVLLGIMPTALTQADIAVIFGALNLVLVAVFRLVELRRRDRRDSELLALRARVRVLEGEQSASGKEESPWQI